MRLAVNQIVVDEEIYPRNDTNWLTVYQYTQAMETGSVFPPLTVGKKDKSYVLLDGRHRLIAWKNRKATTVPVIVSRIAPKDFFAEAIRLNALHGRPLAPQERIRAIVKLRQIGYADVRISKLLWMPLTTMRKLVAERVERIKLSSGHVASVVRKAVIPPGRLKSDDQQRIFAVRSQVDLLDQLVGLIEQGMLLVSDEEVYARLVRIRQLLSTVLAGRSKKKSA